MAVDPQPTTAAKSAVLLQIARAHERFLDQEKALASQGRFGEAREAHRMALRLVKAYRLESDDPDWDTTP